LSAALTLACGPSCLVLSALIDFVSVNHSMVDLADCAQTCATAGSRRHKTLFPFNHLVLSDPTSLHTFVAPPKPSSEYSPAHSRLSGV